MRFIHFVTFKCRASSVNLSQIPPPRSGNPLPKLQAPHYHIRIIKRIHQRLNPAVVAIQEEILDRLLGCGRRGIRVHARAGGCRGGGARGHCVGGGVGVWVGEQEELDRAAGHEAGDVRGGVAVDVLEVPFGDG